MTDSTDPTDPPDATNPTDPTDPTESRSDVRVMEAAAGDTVATASSSPAIGCPSLPLHITVNGVGHRLRVETWVTLLDLLREQLDLTGTKKGCDHGQCGACTVLVDGKRINSCLTLAVMQDGTDITTVEGLASSAAGDAHHLHALQRSFIEHDAFQCGYCTPGQLCSAAGLLTEHPASNKAELRERMSGNLCRCGAYPQIVQAVSQVLAAMSKSEVAAEPLR